MNAKLDWQFDFFFHFFAQQMGPSLASGNLQDTYSLNSPKKSNGLIRFMQSLNNKKVSKKQVMWAVVVLQVAFFNVNCTKWPNKIPLKN